MTTRDNEEGRATGLLCLLCERIRHSLAAIFEQELISNIIADKLEKEGVPLQVDPFVVPPTYIAEDPSPRITDIRAKRDAVLEKIMSGDSY